MNSEVFILQQLLAYITISSVSTIVSLTSHYTDMVL
jgi:hypothetical protein